jgi:hypothetical protein
MCVWRLVWDTRRRALRRCLRHVISSQNADGGFAYRKGHDHSHMGIPSTVAPGGASSMFATWFRVHTLALMAEVLTDEPALSGIPFRFNSTLSMGWHRAWNKADHRVSARDRHGEITSACRWARRLVPFVYRRASARLGRLVASARDRGQFLLV